MIKQTLCFSNPAYLSLRLGQLVIELPETPTASARKLTRPIEDIGLLVIESSSVTLTSALLNELLGNNVAVITCEKKHLPSGLFLPLSGNTLQSERFQAQIQASLPLKKQLWQQTISAKIANQSKVLKKYNPEESGCMDIWSKGVKSNDSSNLEGRAAAFYWRSLFPDNPRFTRLRNSDGVNAMLNYGYAILRAVVARSLVGSGLLPTLGIHHHNRYNAYCLADDVMEPYRPFVDDLVLSILKEKGEPEELTPAIKRALLSIPVLDVNINGVRRPLMIAASMTSSSLAKCFLSEARKILYPIIE